jgi:hypothetical protein
VQEIRTVWRVDTSEIERAGAVMAEEAKKAGVAEAQVNKLSSAYQQTARAIVEQGKTLSDVRAKVERLAIRERELLSLRAKANNPADLRKYDQQLAKIRGRLQQINQADRERIAQAQRLERLQGLINKRIAAGASGKNLDRYKRRLEEVNRELLQLQAGAGQTQNTLSRLGAGLGKGAGLLKNAISSGLGFVGGDLLLSGLSGIGAQFAAVADEAQNFESSLDGLSAITGAEGQALEDLRQRAQNLRVELQNAAGETITLDVDPTAALNGFARIGSQIPLLLQSSEGLQAVSEDIQILNAASRDLTFEEAVAAQTNAINQFKTETADAAEITALSSRALNVLAASSKLGAVEIPGTSQALEKFGSVAANNNVTLEESAAFVQIAGERISDYATVGTNARNIILKLAEEQGNLNPAFQDASGKAIGLTGALRNLAGQNLTTTELTQKFGAENVTAAQILLTNINRLETLTGQLNEAGQATSREGIAAEQAAKNADNFAAAKERLGVAASRLRVTIGSALLPVLTGFVEFVTRAITAGEKFAGNLGKVGDFLARNKEIIILLVTGIAALSAARIRSAALLARETAQTVLNTAAKQAGNIATRAIAIAQGLYSTATGLLTGRLKLATVAQRALNLVLKANPLGLIITAVGGLIAGFVALYNRSQTLRAGMSGLFEALKGTIARAFTGILKQANGFKEILAGIISLDGSRIKAGAKEFSDGLKQTFTSAGANAAKDFQKGFSERVQRETFEGLDSAVGDAIGKQSEEVRDKVNSEIVNALEAGKITNAQADELQKRLIESFDGSQTTAAVDVNTAVNVEQTDAQRRETLEQLKTRLASLTKAFTGTEEEAAAIVNLKTQIQSLEGKIDIDGRQLSEAEKDAAKLKESLEELRFKITLDRAGGEATTEGQRILEEARVKELEKDKAFQALRLTNERDAARLILEERLKFVQARAQINEREAAQASTNEQARERAAELLLIEQTRLNDISRLEELTTERRAALVSQVATEERRAQVEALISAQDFQAARLILEEESAARREEIQRQTVGTFQQTTAARLAAIEEARRLEVEAIQKTADFQALSNEERLNIVTRINESFATEAEAVQASQIENEKAFLSSVVESREEQAARLIDIARESLTRENILQARRLEIAANLERASASEREAIITSISDARRREELATLLEAGQFAEARALIEEDVSRRKQAAQLAFLQRVREVNREAAQANQAAISSLQVQAETGGGLNDAQAAELDKRLKLQKDLNKALLGSEKALQEAQTQATQEGAEARAQIEQEFTAARLDFASQAINQLFNSANQTAEAIRGVFAALEEGGGDVGSAVVAAAQGSLSVVSGFYALQAENFEQAKQRELQAAGNNAAQREQIERKYAEKQKKIQKAQAVIQGAQAVLSIFSAPSVLPAPLDYALKVGLALAVGAQTKRQIGIIDAQGFRDGVVSLQGPGSATSDSIPANLSRGESVVTAKQTANHREILERIHKGEVLQRAIIPGIDNAFTFSAPGSPAPRLEPVKAAPALFAAPDVVTARPNVTLSAPAPGFSLPATGGGIDYNRLTDTLAPRVAREIVKAQSQPESPLFQLLREQQNHHLKTKKAT